MTLSFQPVKFDEFKHNEWEILNITYESNDVEYLCCRMSYGQYLMLILKLNVHM